MIQNLQRKRLEQGLSQEQLANRLGGIEPRIDTPLISKMEGVVCLPTAPVADGLCAIFACGLSELFEERLLCLKSAERPKKAAKPADGKDTYKLTADVPLELANGLKAKLQRLEYDGITDWVIRELKAVHERYERLMDIEKAAGRAGTRTDGKG